MAGTTKLAATLERWGRNIMKELEDWDTPAGVNPLGQRRPLQNWLTEYVPDDAYMEVTTAGEVYVGTATVQHYAGTLAARDLAAMREQRPSARRGEAPNA